MKIKQYLPLILAALMYGLATYLVLFVYLSYDYQPSALSEWTTLFSVLGNIASSLYISGTILVIGYFIIEVLRKRNN